MDIITIFKNLYKIKNFNTWKNDIKTQISEKLINRGIQSIDLCLSAICSANCVFCPKTINKDSNIKYMSLETAKIIADEVASDKFKIMHNVKRFGVGGQGDALLNKNFIEILRYLKQTNPTIPVVLCTNFKNLTKDKSEIIVKERLIDIITVNIDGHDEISYFNVKRLHYKSIEKNVLDFLEIRKEHNSVIKLQIVSLTFADYCNKIHKKFGKYPLDIKKEIKQEDLIDDFELIQKVWLSRLNLKLDVLVRSGGVFGWAERETVKELGHDPSKYICPNISRITNECFIAPNGNWFGCCFDENQKIIFGNVNKESIYDIYLGNNRKEFLHLIKHQNYKKIGYPCIYVEGCQSIK